MPEKKTTSIKIDKETWVKSKILAVKKGKTLAELIEDLLVEAIKKENI